MRRSSLVSFLSLPLLWGCIDSLTPADKPVELPRIKAEDSLAIVEIKRSANAWNGSIRDWVNFATDGHVVELYAVIGRAETLTFSENGLKKLRVLSIGTDLDSLTVFGLRHLGPIQRLYCASRTSKLTKWPRGIFENPGLRELWIQRADLDHITDSISMIDSLKILDLNYNKISTVPSFLLKRSDLFVRLVGNKFCSPTSEEVTWLNSHADWSYQNCSQ